MKKTQCRKCYCFGPNLDAGPGNGFCFKNPPVPVAVPAQNRMTGEMSISIQAVNPPVSEGGFCYSGETKIKILDS